MEKAPPPFEERRRYPRTNTAPLGLTSPNLAAKSPLYFITTKLPDHKQFSSWQAHISALQECYLAEGATAHDGFIAEQTIWSLNGILLVQEVLPAFSYERSEKKLHFNPIDHWQITFLKRGQTWTEAGGHVAHNEPNMMEVRSLGRPFRGRKLATSATTLFMPIDLFNYLGGLPVACSNVVFGGHRVNLVSNYLTSIEANLQQMNQEDITTVKERLRDMIFDAVIPLVNHGTQQEETLQLGLMTKARRFIMNNISSSNLTVEKLCRELGISRTRLYELFEASGGVANYIRRRRLLLAHSIIADPSDNRTIAEVGLAIGIDNAGNFSRAFTQHFGYAPSSVHRRASASKVIQQTTEIQDEQQYETFEGLLRTLGLY